MSIDRSSRVVDRGAPPCGTMITCRGSAADAVRYLRLARTQRSPSARSAVGTIFLPIRKAESRLLPEQLRVFLHVPISFDPGAHAYRYI